jgi:hypothetical protein
MFSVQRSHQSHPVFYQLLITTDGLNQRRWRMIIARDQI